MKRAIILLVVTLLAVPVIAVQAQTVTFWTTETQSERQKTIRTICDTFEILNDGIKIKIVPLDENEIPTQLAAASAAGALPDVIEVGSELSVANAALWNTDAHAELVNKIGADRFFEGALKLVSSTDGKYLGLPYHGWIQGIWYRADWFENAGLQPPDTWENILKAAQYFNKPDKNQYGILIGTKPEAYAEQVFTQFAISNGAREFDESGKLVFNSPAMKETLEYYQKLNAYTPPGPQTWRARDYYIQGKLAMFFYSTYIMDDLALAEVAAGSLTTKNFESLTGGSFDPQLVDKTRMVPIIKNKQDASYGVLVALHAVDTGDATRTQASKKFIEYLYSDAAYVSFLHMAPGGMNPMLKDVAKSAEFLKDPKGIFARYGTEKIYEIINGMSSIQKFEIVNGKVFPVSGEIFAKQIIPQMIYRTLFDKMPVDEALAWAEKEMQKVIEGVK